MQTSAAPLVSRRQQAGALGWGILCHGLFVVGVGAMFVGLGSGMASGRGPGSGWTAWAADLLLLAAFPLLHSVMLTTRGRRALRSALGTSPDLDVTLFATASSGLLLLVFLLWSPLPGPRLLLEGRAATFTWAAYLLGWVLLGISMAEAGLALQTGSLGWISRFRGKAPRYPSAPTQGLHGMLRHPIYLSFTLILWSGAWWSVDKLLLASLWTAYCVFGSTWKERRHEARSQARSAQGWSPAITAERSSTHS